MQKGITIKQDVYNDINVNVLPSDSVEIEMISHDMYDSVYLEIDKIPQLIDFLNFIYSLHKNNDIKKITT